MGVYSTAARDLMLNALKGTNPSVPITHAGLATAGAGISGVTGVAATDVLTKAASGLANGDLVLLTALTGGAGLVAGDAGNANELARPYFVIGFSGSTFQLSLTSGGSAVDFTTDITVLTIIKLTELSGGSPAYARKAIAYAASSGGLMDDSTNGAVFDVAAAAVVDYVTYHSASSAGTLMALDKVTQETFGAQGTYTLTDSKLDLLAA